MNAAAPARCVQSSARWTSLTILVSGLLILTSARTTPGLRAGDDDEARGKDLSGTYISEQVRLELTKTDDGDYNGFRTALGAASVRPAFAVSAKVTERNPERIALQGNFSGAPGVFPFEAVYQANTLRLTSGFSEYRLARISDISERREFMGSGVGGRPIRLLIEELPPGEPGRGTLLADPAIKHGVTFREHGERLSGEIKMDDRTVEFVGRLKGMSLTLDIGPDSYALAAVGPNVVNSDGLGNWFVSAIVYDPLRKRIVCEVHTRLPITETDRERAEFRFAFLSRAGVQSAGPVELSDVAALRGPARQKEAATRPGAPLPRSTYRGRLVVSAEPALLERSSVLRLDQMPIDRPVLP